MFTQIDPIVLVYPACVHTTMSEFFTPQALIGQQQQPVGDGGSVGGASGGPSQVETLTTLLHQAQQLQQLQALQQQVVVSNGNPPPPPPAAMSNQSLHSTGDQAEFNKVC